MEYRWLKLSDLSAGVRQVMINRPEALNALDAELLGELGKCFDELRTDSTVRAVLLTGVGKAFVAGADIKAMAPMNVREGQDFGELGAQTFRKLEQLPMPVIAVVNGYALGGGLRVGNGVRYTDCIGEGGVWAAGSGAGYLSRLWWNPAFASNRGHGDSGRVAIYSAECACRRGVAHRAG